MASLYSAQLVTAAREKLKEEIEERAAEEGTSTPHSGHKGEKHHPYHYGENTHERCKHHGQENKESLLHKKLLEHIDHTKKEEREHEAEQHRPLSFRRIVGERQEIEDEMKKWARVVEASLKKEHKFTEKELHEQHTNIYKWMFFIEELFRNYENTLKTQTSLHALEGEEKRSDKSLQEQMTILSSHRLDHKGKDSHGVKLPHLPSRERMEALQARVGQLEKLLDQSQSHNQQTSKQLLELTSYIHQSDERQRIRNERVKKLQLNLMTLLGQMQAFNTNLLTDLKEPQKLKQYPQLANKNLSKIQEYRQSLIDKTK